MSILRYFNKHHGWYNGARTPYTGVEEVAAAELVLEVAAPEVIGSTFGAEAIGAGITDAALLGGEYLGGLGASGAGEAAIYSGAELGGEYAAQEAAKQAAIQNAGQTQLTNIPAEQVSNYSGNQFGFSQAELNAISQGQADALASGPSPYEPTASTGQTPLVEKASVNSPYTNISPIDTTAGPINPSTPVNTPFQPSGAQSMSEIANNPGMYDRAPIPQSQMPFLPGGIKDYLPSKNQMMVGGGLYALNSLMNQDKNKYGVPAAEKYSGPLSKFKYDPNAYQYNAPVNRQYTPNYGGYARMGYAEGGITQLATGGSTPLIGTPEQNTTMNSSMGNNAMFPMSEMARSYYATPTQLPAGTSENPALPGYGPKVDTSTGQMMNNFAKGGIAGLLKGRGDGMSDSIRATIADKQPARLADGEFVIPADVVSHLGNGSTDAGAKQLYRMMDKVRHARTGSKKQGKQIAAGGYLPIK